MNNVEMNENYFFNHQQNKEAIWIIENESWFRNIFQETINDSGRYVCTGTFESCEDALARVEQYPLPQYVLLDIHFFGKMSGLEMLNVLKQRLAPTKILVITGDYTPATMNTAIQRGIAGYLVKPIEPKEIIPALDEIASGKVPLSAEMARHALHLVPKPLDEQHQNVLTQQEKILLPYFTQGKSDKEIAEKLFRSPETVHTHRKHVYQKLGVHGVKDFIIRMFTEKK